MSEEVSSKVKKIIVFRNLPFEVTEEDESQIFLWLKKNYSWKPKIDLKRGMLTEISDSEAEKILTVGDAFKFIEGKSIY